MLSGLARKARSALRSAAMSGVGAVLFLTGLAFLTVSAWAALSVSLPTQDVALIIGAAYVGLSLVAFAVAAVIGSPEARGGRSTPPPANAAPPPPSAAAAGGGMAQAFLIGLDAGRGMASRKR